MNSREKHKVINLNLTYDITHINVSREHDTAYSHERKQCIPIQ